MSSSVFRNLFSSTLGDKTDFWPTPLEAAIPELPCQNGRWHSWPYVPHRHLDRWGQYALAAIASFLSSTDRLGFTCVLATLLEVPCTKKACDRTTFGVAHTWLATLGDFPLAITHFLADLSSRKLKN